MTVEYPDYRGIGRFEAKAFVPEAWRPRVPNPAYVRSRPDDTFWAARTLMGMTDELIRAAVRAGKYSDARAEQLLCDALIARREAIGKAFLVTVNPVVDPALSSGGRLTFGNAAAQYRFAGAPSSYTVTWQRFDNATGSVERMGETTGHADGVAAPSDLPTRPGSFVRADIAAVGGAHPSWASPVHAYFKRTGEGWTLVGFDRLPDARPMRPGLVGAEPLR
jgi:hypothetical protein